MRGIGLQSRRRPRWRTRFDCAPRHLPREPPAELAGSGESGRHLPDDRRVALVVELVGIPRRHLRRDDPAVLRQWRAHLEQDNQRQDHRHKYARARERIYVYTSYCHKKITKLRLFYTFFILTCCNFVERYVTISLQISRHSLVMYATGLASFLLSKATKKRTHFRLSKILTIFVGSYSRYEEMVVNKRERGHQYEQQTRHGYR